jgi:molybdate transport system ATP-binding protein
MLRADVHLQRGDLDLDVALDAREGETVGVVGPNGAGKTTLLRALAGLETPASGRIELDGEVLDDPASGRHVPAEERSVGFVFQDAVLFPHLSVLDNVAFGLRARGYARGDARREAHAWLARLGLADRAGDRPGALSGGQAQRVALARALAPAPRLLLLDEPLASLDAANQVEVRTALASDLSEVAAVRVLVTHDPVDAAVLADRLVVLEGGRVTQSGSPADLAARPRTSYVAQLVGVNLWRGAADGTAVHLSGGGVLVVAEPRVGPVLVTVRPQAVALHRARPEGSPRNTWAGVVETVEPAGDRVRVRLAGPPAVVAEVTQAAVAALGLRPGTPTWVSVKATELEVSPA